MTPEAPASLTVKFFLGEFDCLLTVRSFAEDKPASELLAALPKLVKRLSDLEARPTRTPISASPPPAPPPETDTTTVPLCPEHGTPMKGSKFATGEWYCPQKVGEQPQTGEPIYCRHKYKEE